MNESESVEVITEKEANLIIDHIINVCDIEPKGEDDKVFSLEFIRDLLSLYKGNSKDNAARILSTWKIADAIMDDSIKDGKYEHMLSKKELRRILTGKFLKEDMLFDKYALNLKKENAEEYSKLLLLLGGNEKGLSKESLTKCLATAEAFASNPKETLKGEISINADSTAFKNAAEEILNLMGSEENFLTINDFINIMTISMKFPDNKKLNSLKFKGD